MTTVTFPAHTHTHHQDLILGQFQAPVTKKVSILNIIKEEKKMEKLL
jgi:hypothetical protein